MNQLLLLRRSDVRALPNRFVSRLVGEPRTYRRVDIVHRALRLSSQQLANRWRHGIGDGREIDTVIAIIGSSDG